MIVVSDDRRLVNGGSTSRRSWSSAGRALELIEVGRNGSELLRHVLVRRVAWGCGRGRRLGQRAQERITRVDDVVLPKGGISKDCTKGVLPRPTRLVS